MSAIFLFVVGVAATNAQFSPRSPSMCAPGLGDRSAICRKVLNRTSGVISPQCLNRDLFPRTGNEQFCSTGQPLWVVNRKGIFSEAACGRVIDRTTCPECYKCNIAPDDTYSLCCPVCQQSDRCPVPDPKRVGICINNCQSDQDCRPIFLCCKNACGGRTCQLPKERIGSSCKTFECPTEFICIDTSKGPQCIYAIGGGKCPAPTGMSGEECSKCKTDLDCPGYQKCCPGRPYYCKKCRIPEPSRTCKHLRCPRGQKCVMKKVVCVREPCFPVPMCV